MAPIHNMNNEPTIHFLISFVINSIVSKNIYVKEVKVSINILCNSF